MLQAIHQGSMTLCHSDLANAFKYNSSNGWLKRVLGKHSDTDLITSAFNMVAVWHELSVNHSIRFREATVFSSQVALGPRARARLRQPFLKPNKARARARGPKLPKRWPSRILINHSTFRSAF